MKAKISLGSGGIKGLILKHVEKAVVALAVLFFGFLVWGASKLGNDFDLQPEELQTASVEADKAIRAPKPKPEQVVPHWRDVAGGIKQRVPADPYGVEKTWMHRLFPGATLRGEPEVYPVEKLRASTGFGGISVSASGALTGGAGSSMAGEMGGYEMEGGMDAGYGGYGGGGLGGNAEGFRWVVVTGLLPYKKQWTEYGNVFRNAEVKLPQRDVPAYILYEIERAEVVPGVEPKEEDWKPLKFRNEFENRKWAGGQPEIVSRKFLHRSASPIPMAYPLPPLVSKSFGPEIAHEPEIPLHYRVERVVEEVEIDWDSLTPEELIEAKKKYGRMGGGGGYGSPGGYGEEYGSGYEQDYGESAMGGYGAEMGSGGYGEEMGGYGAEMGPGGSGGYAGMAGPRREIPEYQLFRFFDFTVDPGRYYQYRVRMMLSNPNHELPPQNLEDEKLSENIALETEWSAPTKVVNVPLDSRVLAGPVSVSSNVNVAPRGELGTVFFNEEDGTEVAEKVTVARGQLLNYLDVEVKEEKPAASLYGGGGYGEEMGSGGYGEMGDYGEMGGYGETTRKKDRRRDPKEPPKTVDYVTEMLVLDFLGGALLPGTDRNMKEPGRILLMDPAGNLILQEELADQEEYVEFFPPEVKKKKKAETDNPYGDDGGYGSMMMEGGEY